MSTYTLPDGVDVPSEVGAYVHLALPEMIDWAQFDLLDLVRVNKDCNCTFASTSGPCQVEHRNHLPSGRWCVVALQGPILPDTPAPWDRDDQHEDFLYLYEKFPGDFRVCEYSVEHRDATALAMDVFVNTPRLGDYVATLTRIAETAE